MQDVQVILKFDEVSERDRYKLRRIEGTITADSLIRLITIADLEANPREAKVGSVTEDILESLDLEDQLFQFKTKGLLISAGQCERLDRNRYRLSFTDKEIEGILDGGHNLLAMAIHFLRNSVDDWKKISRGKKRWEEVKDLWTPHSKDVEAQKDLFEFLTPVEVVYPQDDATGRDEFESAILDIAQARNNNAQLADEAKAHKKGHYEFLKDVLDPKLVDQIEWKTNDGGRIKARDLVALAWIPLKRLGEDHLPGMSEINAVSIYRNKGICVRAFSKLMDDKRVTSPLKGDIRELHHPGIKSALEKMKEIPKLCDLIYKRFPAAYNSKSPRFGGILCVRRYEEGKTKKANGRKVPREKGLLSRPPKTKYYQEVCEYEYPDGFIMPLIWALSELMEVKNGKLEWATDPIKFIERNLDQTLNVFQSIIQVSNYDPQKVGKQKGCYEIAAEQFGNALFREQHPERK